VKYTPHENTSKTSPKAKVSEIEKLCIGVAKPECEARAGIKEPIWKFSNFGHNPMETCFSTIGVGVESPFQKICKPN